MLGGGRLGFLVDFLSHSVLVGFTAAAALIIGFSQVKHVLGVSVPRPEHFIDTVREVFSAASETHGATAVLGLTALVVLLVLKRVASRLPAALLAVTAVVITIVGFMESIAVAKCLPAATAGLFGGYPITGGLSRTAVNDTAGALTPLPSSPHY